jgi:hypothetical protein
MSTTARQGDRGGHKTGPFRPIRPCTKAPLSLFEFVSEMNVSTITNVQHSMSRKFKPTGHTAKCYTLRHLTQLFHGQVSLKKRFWPCYRNISGLDNRGKTRSSSLCATNNHPVQTRTARQSTAHCLSTPSTARFCGLVNISHMHRWLRWRSWLRHCATSRKVAGSIPDGFIGIFH